VQEIVLSAKWYEPLTREFISHYRLNCGPQALTTPIRHRQDGI
jgi:hypothetical protein